MKNCFRLAKALFCLTPVLFFSGCSSDSELYSEEPVFYLTGSKNGVISPYDSMGKAYDSIYREYRNIYNDSIVSTRLIISRVEEIAGRTVISEPYLQIEEEAVEDIISGSITPQDYANVVLSTEARNLFIPFLNSLDGMSDNDVYIAAFDFESQVLSDVTLNGSDTEILLTAISVMKYHTENGDDDWSDQGTTITKAVLYGSRENSSKAVIMAVVVRLIMESY